MSFTTSRKNPRTLIIPSKTVREGYPREDNESLKFESKITKKHQPWSGDLPPNWSRPYTDCVPSSSTTQLCQKWHCGLTSLSQTGLVQVARSSGHWPTSSHLKDFKTITSLICAVNSFGYLSLSLSEVKCFTFCTFVMLFDHEILQVPVPQSHLHSPHHYPPQLLGHNHLAWHLSADGCASQLTIDLQKGKWLWVKIQSVASSCVVAQLLQLWSLQEGVGTLGTTGQVAKRYALGLCSVPRVIWHMRWQLLHVSLQRMLTQGATTTWPLAWWTGHRAGAKAHPNVLLRYLEFQSFAAAWGELFAGSCHLTGTNHGLPPDDKALSWCSLHLKILKQFN